ncbi:MAG: dihydrofolate reductase [Planctomycetota bacterium]|nr:dihydrofolate reductase [Planctomycetota bacterium]
MALPRGPHLGLIVAYARNRVIGRAGGLPWREPEDLRHFKRVTMGHAIVMGRVSHASIGRALPGRRNLVVTRNPDYEAPGCEVFPTLEAALEAAWSEDACPFVIGGAQIYALALPRVTRLEITELALDVEGDTFFPELDAEAWREVHRREHDGGRLAFRTLVRVTS